MPAEHDSGADRVDVAKRGGIGKARGVGFAGLVSIGNEIDLSIGEICAATLDDPDIDSYMLFLETIRQRERQLMEVLFDGDAVAGETELRAILGQAP